MNNEYVFSDARKFAAGGPWSCAAADIVRNYPSCKMFLSQDDLITGTATWADRIAALTLNATGVFTKGAYGVWGAATSVTGAMPVIGDLYPLLIWQGRAVTAVTRVSVGDASTGAGIDLSGNNLGYAAASAANYVSVNVLSAVPTYPFDGTMSLYIDTDATVADGQVYKQYANATGSSVSTANKTGVDGGTGVNATFGTLANSITIPAASTTGAKMIALLCFAVQPTFAEVNAGMKWMAANEGKLYPGFAGKT